jgi:formylglycine-generating enzyme required for sulfatase activity
MRISTILAIILAGLPVSTATSSAQTVSNVTSTIQITTEQNSDQAIISWFGLSNTQYRIQYLNDIDTGDWTDLEPTPRMGANASLSVTIGFEDANHRFYRIVKLNNSITIVDLSMKLMEIPAGTFVMGSPDSEVDRGRNAEPLTTVTITKPFWLGATEVTQGQWKAVMGNNRSRFKINDQFPVERVSWNDAVAFCDKLNQMYGNSLPPGYRYSLPTEAQWEYACRAGTTTRFFFGDDLDYNKLGQYAWYRNNSEGESHSVGEKLPNDWGLYDMHGNVWEWCSDWYSASYPGGNVTDPQGPGSGRFRLLVLRGGSWDESARICRSAVRNGWSADYWNDDLGFRVALSSVP